MNGKQAGRKRYKFAVLANIEQFAVKVGINRARNVCLNGFPANKTRGIKILASEKPKVHKTRKSQFAALLQRQSKSADCASAVMKLAIPRTRKHTKSPALNVCRAQIVTPIIFFPNLALRRTTHPCNDEK